MGKNTFTTPKGKKAAKTFPAKKPGAHGDKEAPRKALFPPAKKRK